MTIRQFIDIIEQVEQIHPEASLEDAYDIAEEFARQHEEGSSHNEIYADLPNGKELINLFVGGYREDGFSLEYAERLIQPLVYELKQHGWFLAKRYAVENPDHDDEDSTPQLLCYFDFFPQQGKREMLGAVVYHVSPRGNRAEITRHGIRPSTGGNDFITTETPRVYVILDEYDIDGVISDLYTHRKWVEFDVWVIDVALCPDDWFEDAELPGVSAWTTAAIPAHAVTLYDEIDFQ